MARNLRAFLGLTAAVSILCATEAPANAQNLPGWGYAQRFIGDATRQQQQRQQQLAQQQADARARAPHAGSVSYSGELTPVTDLKKYISGRTLYLESPIVAGDQIVSMNKMAVYFSADGQSFSPFWAGKAWIAEGNTFCVGASSPDHCVRVFQDSTHQVFAMSPQNVLQHLARIEVGDTERFKAAYARVQSAQAPAQPNQQPGRTQGPNPFLNALQDDLIQQTSTPHGLWQFLNPCTKTSYRNGKEPTYSGVCD